MRHGAAHAEHTHSRPSRALNPTTYVCHPQIRRNHFAMAKTIAYDEEARRGLERGLNSLADAVKVT